MTQPLTTYRATGRTNGLTFLFKYDLKGVLREFKIESGEMNDQQMFWLYSQKFPAKEELMISNWIKKDDYRKVFEVKKSPADVSFEAFWQLYGLKVKKEPAQKVWNKLSEANIIKCFLKLPEYEDFLKRTGQAKAHLVTYLNQKRYDDEY